MRLNTCSAVIARAREMEEEAAVFYERLARDYPARGEFFRGLARENRKWAAQIERAYYGTISDAIEGSFAFDLAADEYEPDLALPAADCRAALARARAAEATIMAFYREAARQSGPLLADIPRVLAQVVKKREERAAQLQARENDC